MDKVKVARELLKMARGLVAVKSPFTVMKVLQLKREGATKDSIENARLIADAGYEVLSTEFTFDQQRADHDLEVQFYRRSDGHTATWVFKGFYFGYGGEGPRGLIEFSKIFGLGLNADKITSGPGALGIPERGKISLSVFK